MLALVLAGALAQLADQVVAAAPPRGGLSISSVGAGRVGWTLGALVVSRLRQQNRLVNPPEGAWDFNIGCDVQLMNDKLQLQCDVYAESGELWRHTTGTRPGLVRHIYAEVPADDEARALAGSVPVAPPTRKPGWNVLRTLPIGDLDVLAIAVGRSEGVPAVFALTEREVLVWKLLAGTPKRLPTQEPLLPAATRVPVGSLLVWPNGTFVARTSSRAPNGLARDGYPLGIGPDGRILFAGLDVQRVLWQLPTAWPHDVHAVATATIRDQWFGAAVEDGGRLVVYRGAPGNVHFAATGAGDAVTIWDADGDGDPEVATSMAAAPGDGDQIIVRNARGEVWHSSLIPGAITALAAGDVLGDGQQQLVAVVRDRAAGRTELWLVQ